MSIEVVSFSRRRDVFPTDSRTSENGNLLDLDRGKWMLSFSAGGMGFLVNRESEVFYVRTQSNNV